MSFFPAEIAPITLLLDNNVQSAEYDASYTEPTFGTASFIPGQPSCVLGLPAEIQTFVKLKLLPEHPDRLSRHSPSANRDHCVHQADLQTPPLRHVQRRILPLPQPIPDLTSEAAKLILPTIQLLHPVPPGSDSVHIIAAAQHVRLQPFAAGHRPYQQRSDVARDGWI